MKLQLWPDEQERGFAGLLVSVVFVILTSLPVNADSQFVFGNGAEAASSTPGRLFPCIQSLPVVDRKNRVAVLRGPDWVLGSSIKPSCFPERDLVFVTTVGQGLIAHPFTARTRLWITKDHDVTQIRIVDSSGSEERDMVAVSFATNHKCISRSSKSCSVKGGAVLFRID
jgi:hypothetical protein